MISLTLFILILVLLHKKASFFGLHLPVEEEFSKQPTMNYIPTNTAKPTMRKKPILDF
ncbi:MAG: hypothetical protein M3142_12815 [Bacteroidota bacterium]|nr:hypothetical protein [Bacteroidota bacterium]